MDNFTKYYSPLVLKHVSNPQNMGKIRNPDGEAMVGNPVCGDIMKFYIKVGINMGTEFLKDVKFQTLGCGAAIATSSVLCTLVKGKSLKEAKNISKSEIIKRALILFFKEYQKKHNPYDLGKDLFGQYGSGIGNLSKNYKKIIKDKLNEKYSR